MGQQNTKDPISRRPVAFNSLTPRAEIFTVPANRSTSAEHKSFRYDIKRPSSTNANSVLRGAGTIHNIKSMTDVKVPTQTTVVAEDPYMLNLTASSSHPPKSILKKRSYQTMEIQNPQIPLQSVIPVSTQSYNNYGMSTTSNFLNINSNAGSSVFVKPIYPQSTQSLMPISSSLSFQSPRNTMANVPLASSVINIPSSMSLGTYTHIDSTQQLMSFADQPTRNQGYDGFQYGVNKMKVQKMGMS